MHKADTVAKAKADSAPKPKADTSHAVHPASLERDFNQLHAFQLDVGYFSGNTGDVVRTAGRADLNPSHGGTLAARCSPSARWAIRRRSARHRPDLPKDQQNKGLVSYSARLREPRPAARRHRREDVARHGALRRLHARRRVQLGEAGAAGGLCSARSSLRTRRRAALPPQAALGAEHLGVGIISGSCSIRRRISRRDRIGAADQCAGQAVPRTTACSRSGSRTSGKSTSRMPRGTLIRRVTFAAAHRYRRAEWSDAKNDEVFGACAEPALPRAQLRLRGDRARRRRSGHRHGDRPRHARPRAARRGDRALDRPESQSRGAGIRRGRG